MIVETEAEKMPERWRYRHQNGRGATRAFHVFAEVAGTTAARREGKKTEQCNHEVIGDSEQAGERPYD